MKLGLAKVQGRNEPLLGLCGLVFVSLLWGSSFVVIKVAAASFTPIGIAAYRVTIAAICLYTLAASKGYRFPRDLKTLTLLFLLSVFGQVIPFVCLGIAGHLTSSQSSAMMMGATPLVTFLLGGFWLPEESWSWRKWIALLAGLTGVIVALSGAGEVSALVGSAPNSDFEGKLFALLAATGYASGAILSRIASKRLPPLSVCAVSMTMSAAILWIGKFATGTVEAQIPTGGWIAVAVLGVVNTALAYGVYFWLISFAGATFASLNNYIVPIIGLAMGYLLLAEPMDVTSIIGLVLILTGVGFFKQRTQ